MNKALPLLFAAAIAGSPAHAELRDWTMTQIWNHALAQESTVFQTETGSYLMVDGGAYMAWAFDPEGAVVDVMSFQFKTDGLWTYIDGRLEARSLWSDTLQLDLLRQPPEFLMVPEAHDIWSGLGETELVTALGMVPAGGVLGPMGSWRIDHPDGTVFLYHPIERGEMVQLSNSDTGRVEIHRTQDMTRALARGATQ